MSLQDTPDFIAQPDVSLSNFNNSATDTEGGERFFLDQLNIEVNASLAELHGGSDTNPADVSANSWANINIPVSYARNLFQYQVDGVDVNDENLEDIKFRMFHLTADSGSITNANDNLKLYNSKNVIPAASKVYFNAIPFYRNADVSNNSREMTVNADFVRHIAKEIFGISATDLFNNETYVRNNLNISSNTQYVSKITELVDLTTDGSYVLMNETGNTLRDKFPTKLIFKQMLDNVRSRFNNISETDVSNNLIHLFDSNNNPITLSGNEIFDSSGVRIDPSNNQTLWHKLPLMENDMLFFKLTIAPHEDQELQVAREGNVNVPERSYRIRLKLVADNDASLSDPLEWSNLGWDQSSLYTNAVPVSV